MRIRAAKCHENEHLLLHVQPEPVRSCEANWSPLYFILERIYLPFPVEASVEAIAPTHEAQEEKHEKKKTSFCYRVDTPCHFGAAECPLARTTPEQDALEPCIGTFKILYDLFRNYACFFIKYASPEYADMILKNKIHIRSSRNIKKHRFYEVEVDRFEGIAKRYLVLEFKYLNDD